MPSLGTCQPSERKAVAPRPRKKQPRPVRMADLLGGQKLNGRKRFLGTTPTQIRKRFMLLVEKTKSGCWLWNGSINKSRGYGIASFGKGRGFLAHRVSYVLFVGAIPRGLLVLHDCDVRRCVNPAHFFLGTDGDNAKDSMNKLRKPSKLKPQDIPVIRRLYFEDCWSQRRVAAHFGVTQSNISHVLKGNTWAHI
jgi:hypothetical protein